MKDLILYIIYINVHTLVYFASVGIRFKSLHFQELNERERAEHATRKYDQLQSLIKELEERNAELEQKFAEVWFVHILLKRDRTDCIIESVI